MRSKLGTAVATFVACAGAAVVARGVAAHHSDSLYFVDDRSADGGAIRIQGTVSRVRWINPHSEFFVEVPGASGGGEATTWAIETDSVNQLRALGWDEKTLEVGDKVVVVVSKSKFDDTAGRLRDMLILGAAPEEPAKIYLEFKGDGNTQWQAPYELYKRSESCPGTAPFDAERQPGKETLLCATLDTAELDAARREFGPKVLLLRN
jgi:hypothetical protein